MCHRGSQGISIRPTRPFFQGLGQSVGSLATVPPPNIVPGSSADTGY
jgi:hypothetical protein